MNIEAYYQIVNELSEYGAQLVAVSKTKPVEDIELLLSEGQHIFGENKVQEMCDKQEQLEGRDINWHMIGHLQRNKVKYMAPFVALVHGVDSLRLIKEINKQGAKANRAIPCLLQMHIAEESTKFGLDRPELDEVLKYLQDEQPSHLEVRGLMGMATNTEVDKQIAKEFGGLFRLYDELKDGFFAGNDRFDTLSMGMSGDYKIALNEGSNMVRVGSLIFGERNY